MRQAFIWIGRVAFAGLAAIAWSASAGTVTYYHNDLVGSPIAATNDAGQVVWRESYRPYGERLTNDAQAPGSGVWYASRRQDSETGLVYMGARYYEPIAGRFMGVDPMQFEAEKPHSFNRYAYGNNNPYRYKDPDGRVAETIFDVVSFGISVAMFKQDPSLGNFFAAAVDGVALAVPFVPGGVGVIRAAGKVTADAAVDVASVAFKTEHYQSRLVAAGLDVKQVEAMVSSELSGARMVEGAEVATRMRVGEVTVEARARMMADGTISVGTIFPVK